MAKLSCKQAEKLVVAFIKDDMDNATKKLFLNHILTCASCREELSIQFLVTAGMKRLENGDTFDLNRELRHKIETERRHLQVLDSLQRWLGATEAVALLAAVLILVMVVL